MKQRQERAFGLIDALFALFFGGEVIIRMLVPIYAKLISHRRT